MGIFAIQSIVAGVVGIGGVAFAKATDPGRGTSGALGVALLSIMMGVAILVAAFLGLVLSLVLGDVGYMLADVAVLALGAWFFRRVM